MKNILIIICFTQFCFCQTKKEQAVYLNYDSNSKITYLVEINGKKVKEKFYSMGIKKSGEITLYIGREMFSSHIKKNDTCKIDYLKNIKFSKIENLKNEVKKINPLYPYKVYPNLFLVEKINDTTIVKYKVKWEYYIE